MKHLTVILLMVLASTALAKDPPETHREKWSDINSSCIYNAPHTRWFIGGWIGQKQADERLGLMGEALSRISYSDNVNVKNHPRVRMMERIYDWVYQYFHREELIAVRIAVYTNTALRIRRGSITLEYPWGVEQDHGVYRIDEKSDDPYDRNATHVFSKRSKQPTYLYVLMPDSCLGQKFTNLTFTEVRK